MCHFCHPKTDIFHRQEPTSLFQNLHYATLTDLSSQAWHNTLTHFPPSFQTSEPLCHRMHCLHINFVALFNNVWPPLSLFMEVCYCNLCCVVLSHCLYHFASFLCYQITRDRPSFSDPSYFFYQILLAVFYHIEIWWKYFWTTFYNCIILVRYN